VAKADFGELVHRERLKRGLSLRSLAHRVGLDPSRLYRIERGARPPPPLSYIRALSRTLGIPMVDLLVATGTPKEVLETLLWSERLSFQREEAFVPFHPELWTKNTFVVEVVGRKGALQTVLLGETRLEVISFSQAERLKITVPPEAVLLTAPHDHLGQPGTRNILSGRVIKARLLGELVDIVLSCPGFEINALVPEWTRKALALDKGREVLALIPTPAIRTAPLEGETGKEEKA